MTKYALITMRNFHFENFDISTFARRRFLTGVVCMSWSYKLSKRRSTDSFPFNRTKVAILAPSHAQENFTLKPSL